MGSACPLYGVAAGLPFCTPSLLLRLRLLLLLLLLPPQLLLQPA